MLLMELWPCINSDQKQTNKKKTQIIKFAHHIIVHFKHVYMQRQLKCPLMLWFSHNFQECNAILPNICPLTQPKTSSQICQRDKPKKIINLFHYVLTLPKCDSQLLIKIDKILPLLLSWNRSQRTPKLQWATSQGQYPILCDSVSANYPRSWWSLPPWSNSI